MGKYNSFINDGYIDSAIEIRNTFLRLYNSTLQYESKMESFMSEIEIIANELEKYRDSNFDDEKDLDKLGEKLVSRLKDIEVKMESINNILEPIQRDKKELENSEQRLFETLKDKYPNKTDEELKEEISKFIE